jgi:hypothetical protein
MSGKITLSIEIELGWGSHMTSTYNRYSARREKETRYLHKLLDICDKNKIPITFNVVGKLLSEDDRGQNLDFYPDGWWDDYRTANNDLKKLFFAPDLIKKILDADVDHEIATHTFSHIMIDEVPDQCLAYELETVQEIYQEWGIQQPRSFVSPRHRQFNSKILTDHDISVVRVPDPDQSSPNIGISAWMLFRNHPVKEPKIENNIIKTYSSSYPSLTYSGVLPKGQLEADTHFQYLPVKLRQRLQSRYLKNSVLRAENKDSHTHLWTHLWDMSNEEQWEPIEKFIIWLSDQNTATDIDILRMQDLSSECHI